MTGIPGQAALTYLCMTFHICFCDSAPRPLGRSAPSGPAPTSDRSRPSPAGRTWTLPSTQPPRWAASLRARIPCRSPLGSCVRSSATAVRTSAPMRSPGLPWRAAAAATAPPSAQCSRTTPAKTRAPRRRWRFPELPTPTTRESLERCARRDASGAVAARCRERPSSPARTHPALIYVVADGLTVPRPGAAYAMLLADGTIHAGATDRRGATFDPVAPEGQVTLRPAALLSGQKW